MNEIIRKVLVLYAFIFLGSLIGVFLKKNKNDDLRIRVRTILTKILINFVSPVQIFVILLSNQSSINVQYIFTIIFVASVTFIGNLLTMQFFIKKREDFSAGTKGTLILCVTFPNVMFFTIPLILALFSEELVIVSVFFAIAGLIIRGTIGIIVSKKYDETLEKEETDLLENIIQVLKDLFTFPPFLAILISIILISIKINTPEFIFDIKPFINNLASNSSLILVGLIIGGLTISETRKNWVYIKIIVFWQFIVAFLLFISVIYFVTFPFSDVDTKRILLLIIVGPPAVFNVIFSVYFHLNERLAAIAVATLTLLSLSLLPVILYLGTILF